MLDSMDLEKIMLKLCGSHLELEQIETVDLLEYFCVHKLQVRIGH